MQYITFCDLLLSRTMFSKFMHVVTTSHYLNITCFIYLFISQQIRSSFYFPATYIILLWTFVYFVFGTQGIALARQMLYTWTTPPTLFASGIFQIGSNIYAQAGLDCDPPIFASHIAGITGTHHHTQLFSGWDGVSLILPLLISASQVTRITGMSYCTQLVIQIFVCCCSRFLLVLWCWESHWGSHTCYPLPLSYASPCT
jgi:hypothetical protein